MKTLVIDTKELVKIKKTNFNSLYIWMGRQFNGSIIVDVGTARGRSAKAFSGNANNLVITYDIDPIEDVAFSQTGALQRLQALDNVIWKQLDCNLIEPRWLSHVDVILLDVNPHDGIQEAEFLKRIEPYFKGVLLMDDVTDEERWPELFRLFHSLEREHHVVLGIGIVPYGDWTVVVK